MRPAIITKLILALTSVIGIPVAPAQIWFPYAYTTNAVAITNARVVVDALLVGDAQSKSNLHTLIGSSVIFAGWPVDGWSPTNVPLMLGSNIVVRVELPAPKEKPRQLVLGGHRLTLPPQDQFDPGCNAWSAMVEGTLKSVDFQNRVIYVRSPPGGLRTLWGK